MATTLGVGVTNYGQGIVSTVNFVSGGALTRSVGVVTQLPSGTDLTGDPRVLAFKHNGADRVLVSSYQYVSSGTGTAVYGVYAPTASGSWGSPIATATSAAPDPTDLSKWGVSNPWGLVSIGDYLYIQDNDISNAIAVIDMTNDAYTLAATVSNVFTTTGSFVPHGSGMDVYTIEDEELNPVNILVALYYQSNSASTTYGNSGIVLLRANGTTVTKIGTQLATLTENATSVTVEQSGASYYAFVTAFGGSQQAGGNGSASTVQVVTLPNSVSSGVYSPAIALSKTITATTTPSTFGDFNDLEFWNTYAYILASNYDVPYQTYTFKLIRVSTASLLAGNFSGSSTTDDPVTGVPLTSSPAGATWLLAPAYDTLWLVDGNYVHTVAPGVLTNTSSLTIAADYTDGTVAGSVGLGNNNVNGYLNTASVVIDISSLRTRSVGAKVHISRTKVGLSIEELKRRRGLKK